MRKCLFANRSGACALKSDRQLREEIAHNRKLLRERKRKAIGLPSRAPRTFTKNGHEYLVGVLAHTQRRIEIFTNAGGEVAWLDKSDPATVEEIKPATCQYCVEPHLIYWSTFHWHHNVKTKGGKRCDCAACGLAVCEPAHIVIHNRVIAARQINEFPTAESLGDA